MKNQLSVIITGATGMVGEGVLLECLKSDKVDKVLIINRKPSGITHPKLKEIIHSDFYDIQSILEHLRGYNTCLFCLGVSSVGMNESDYKKVTYDLTIQFAKSLHSVNPDMVFEYISGAGTYSSEQGKLMWARMKGKTENDLQKIGFKKVYNLRPGILMPTKGQKNTLSYYKYLGFLLKPIIALFPKTGSKLSELGCAMIQLAYENNRDESVVEVVDIKKISKLV
jgi:uncharacterized protein YbjT (DUF2867 family)